MAASGPDTSEDRKGKGEGGQEQGKGRIDEAVAREGAQQPERKLAAGQLQGDHREGKRQGSHRDQGSRDDCEDGPGGLVSALADPVALGIIAALVLGKPIGILGTTWLLTKATKASLDRSLKWIDVFGVSLLAGIGFTVSLLLAELSFAPGSGHDDHAKVAILAASLLAALLAAAVLVARNRHYRTVEAEEAKDSDRDGIPDVYEQDSEP